MTTATLELTSQAFEAGGAIPRRHAFRGEGQNISPPLAWGEPPDGTVEHVLICDDPDAPTDEPWVHWLLYGIPATVHELPEGLPANAETLRLAPVAYPDALRGARQGMNSWALLGWGGPLPPEGDPPHHYHFRLFALDRQLELPAGATKPEVLRAMEGRVIAEGDLVGTYARTKR